MFLALREIIYARGRCGLMAGVIGLITLLVVMLSGLTGGLAKQNTSALERLNPDRYVMTASDGEYTFTSSRLTEDDIADWRGVEGVVDVQPFGAQQTSMDTVDGTTAVAVIGLEAGTELPGGSTVPEEGVIASESLGLGAGETVTLSGITSEVEGYAPDEYFAHSPVVWTSTETWQKAAHVDEDVVGNALMVSGDLDGGAWEEASISLDSDALSMTDTFNALPSYKSEQGSLMLIQAFLYGISALVIVSFLTVWTIQRTRDLAVLRALGATSRYLFVDALGQALLILAVGAGAGALLGLGLSSALSGVVPIEVSLTTTVLPAVGIVALGIVGAAVAVRGVTRINPLIAFNQA